jgi:RHS repeat-associated protein
VKLWLGIAVLGLAIGAALASIDSASADSTTVAATITSVGRASSGALTYDVAMTASGFTTTDSVCENRASTPCSFGLEVQYASDSSTHVLTTQAWSTSWGDPLTDTLNSTANVPTISAVRAYVLGNSEVDSPWQDVSDPYPLYASASLTDVTVARNSQGSLVFGATEATSGFSMPGRICESAPLVTCTYGVQVQYASDNSTHTLTEMNWNASIGDAASHQFSDFTANVPTILAVRAFVAGSSELDSMWQSVSDPYPPAESASLTLDAPVSRDSQGQFVYDATMGVEGFRMPGRICAIDSTPCTYGIQVKYTSDNSVHTIYSSKWNSNLGDPFSLHLPAQSVALPPVSAIRDFVAGSSEVDSPWQSVSDPYPPAESVKLSGVTETVNPDHTLNISGILTVAGFRMPGRICDVDLTRCELGVGSEDIVGTGQNLIEFQWNSNFGDPAIVPFTKTEVSAAWLHPFVSDDGQSISGTRTPTAGLPPTEAIAGSNPSEKPCQCNHADPVNTATGEFFQNATDDSIPGIGPALQIARSYSSTNAAVDGPFGYGWSASFGANLTFPAPGLMQVIQENGSSVEFAQQPDGSFLAPDRVLASLHYDPAYGRYTFTRQSKEVMVFDSSGELLTSQDLHGNTITVTHDSNGHVDSLNASGGRSISLTWTDNHVTGATDSAGRTVSYAYDESGDLTGMTGINSSTTHYGYNATHYLTTITKPGGGVTINTYDSSHRISSQLDPLDRETTFDYGTSSTTTTTPDGSKTTEDYNGAGVLVSQTKAVGTSLAVTTSYTYDSADNLESVTDPLGKVTHHTYDSNGNVLTTSTPLGHVTTYTYDSLDDVTSVTDPLGHEVDSTYNSSGDRLSDTSPSGRIEHWTYNTDGTMATSEDARGKTTHYGYNMAGDRTSTTDPDGRTNTIAYNSAGNVTSVTDAAGKTTNLTADAAGNVLTSTDPNSHTTTNAYDADGNLMSVEDANSHTVSTTYDEADEATSTTDADGHTTTYVYTVDGQLSVTTDPKSNSISHTYNALGEMTSTTDGNGHVTHFGYDGDGRPTSTTLPSGAETTVGYDDDGLATSETDAKGKITHLGYDAAGQQISTTDPLGRETDQSYTSNGQLDTVTLPDSSTEAYTYNDDGQPTEFTNADAEHTTYSYDDAGLVTAKNEPGGLDTSYAYDSDGRLHITTNPDATTTTATYDDAGQLTNVHSSVSGSTDVTYIYDPAGQRTSMTDETGTSTYSYTADGKLSEVTDGAGTHIGYEYDSANRLTSMTYPGSHQVQYGYDNANQMTSLTDWSNNETDFSWTNDGQLHTQTDPNGVVETISHDVDGQTTDIADAKGSSTLAYYSYGYDDAGQLTSDATTTAAATVANEYGYDADNQLTTVTQGAATSAYSATSAGELTGDISGSALGYNSAQEVTSQTPITGAVSSFAYNDNGSRTSSTVAANGITPIATTNYTYDPAGNLVSVTIPGTTPETVTYTSNGDGLRASRTANSVTDNFLWDVSASVPLLLDDGNRTYLYGPSTAPIAQIDDVTHSIEYLYSDLIGSTRTITDGAGAVIGTSAYDAFGDKTAHTGTATSAIGYSGNWTDRATGLVYLRARDYDPSTAQFIQVDPETDSTHQPYAYVANDPLSLNDPLGLCDAPGAGPGECTPEDFGANPFMLSPIGEGIGNILTQGVTGHIATALVGLGDGASGGITSDIVSLVPGAACAIPHDGFYYGGMVTGVAASSVAGGGAGAQALGRISGVGDLFEAASDLAITPKLTRVFWSGKSAAAAAEEWANANNGITLGMTEAGQATASLTQDIPWSEARPLWKVASGEFARSAGNSVVHVFQEASVSMDSIWREDEYSPLVKQGATMVFHFVGN